MHDMDWSQSTPIYIAIKQTIDESANTSFNQYFIGCGPRSVIILSSVSFGLIGESNE